MNKIAIVNIPFLRSNLKYTVNPLTRVKRDQWCSTVMFAHRQHMSWYVCNEVHVARAQHRDAIIASGFLLKRSMHRPDSNYGLPRDNRTLSRAKMFVSRRKRLSRALIHDSIARIISSLSLISTVQQNILCQLAIQKFQLASIW